MTSPNQDETWLDSLYLQLMHKEISGTAFRRHVQNHQQEAVQEAVTAELQSLVDGDWDNHGDVYYTALKRIAELQASSTKKGEV